MLKEPLKAPLCWAYSCTGLFRQGLACSLLPKVHARSSQRTKRRLWGLLQAGPPSSRHSFCRTSPVCHRCSQSLLLSRLRPAPGPCVEPCGFVWAVWLCRKVRWTGNWRDLSWNCPTELLVPTLQPQWAFWNQTLATAFSPRRLYSPWLHNQCWQPARLKVKTQ